MRHLVTQYTDFIKAFFTPECHSVSRHKCKRNKTQLYEKSTDFLRPIFTTFTNVPQHYVQNLFTDFQKNRTTNVESKVRSLFTALCKIWIFLPPIFTKFIINQQSFVNISLNFFKIRRKCRKQDKILFTPFSNTPIFAKLVNADWNYVEIVYTEFHRNRSRNVQSTSRNTLTLLNTV